MKVLLATAILLFSGFCAFSQKVTRVAIIDSSRFETPGGIERLNRALSFLYSTDTACTFQCGGLKREVERLEKEIKDLKSGNGLLGDRDEKLQQVKGELDRLENSDKESRKKMFALVLEPVLRDIQEALKKFAAEKDFDVIVDQNSTLFDSTVLAVAERVPDVTLEFVKFCNESFERKTTK